MKMEAECAITPCRRRGKHWGRLTVLGHKLLELLEVEFLLRASGTHCDDVELERG